MLISQHTEYGLGWDMVWGGTWFEVTGEKGLGWLERVWGGTWFEVTGVVSRLHEIRVQGTQYSAGPKAR